MEVRPAPILEWGGRILWLRLRRPIRGIGFGWRLPAVLAGGIIVLPMLVLAGSFGSGLSENLGHLATTVLPEALLNTLILFLLVGLGTTFIGIVTAWLVTMYVFPGSRALQWLLLMPLAMPAYIVGYAWSDALAFAGPVQTWIRTTFALGRDDYWFPEAEGAVAAALMLVLALYPYTYFLTRLAFLEQPASAHEVAQTMGYGPAARLIHVAVPLARPAIIAGLALVLFETLADFGTVQYFALHTFTTLIYRTWFGMGDPLGAAQLSTMLLCFAIGLLALERMLRGSSQYASVGRREHPLQPVPLRGVRAGAAFIVCLLPVLLGFALPVVILIRLHMAGGVVLTSAAFVGTVSNSVAMAGFAAVFIVALATLLAFALRLSNHPVERAAIRSAGLGYAVPGTVVAIGLLWVLGAADSVLGSVAALLGLDAGLIVSGTFAALLLAYAVRFLAAALGTLEAAYARVPLNIDAAARSLGSTPGRLLARVHAPLLRRAWLTGTVLVFADILKELPATLVIRPFNFDTLAVRVYQLASDERLAQAATGSLVIAAVGLLPVFLLSRSIARDRY